MVYYLLRIIRIMLFFVFQFPNKNICFNKTETLYFKQVFILLSFLQIEINFVQICREGKYNESIDLLKMFFKLKGRVLHEKNKEEN